MFETVVHTTIQSTVPSYMRGRVVSLQITTWGLSALGGFPLGIMADKIGTNYAIASSNALLLIVGIIFGVILIKSGMLTQLDKFRDSNEPEA